MGQPYYQIFNTNTHTWETAGYYVNNSTYYFSAPNYGGNTRYSINIAYLY